MRFLALAVVAGLTATASAQTPPAPLHLIPMPREVSFKGDQPITGVTVECPNCGADDQFAAGDLRDELTARGIPAGDGLRIVLQRLGQHPDTSFTEAMRPEGFITPIRIIGYLTSGHTILKTGIQWQPPKTRKTL